LAKIFKKKLKKELDMYVMPKKRVIRPLNDRVLAALYCIKILNTHIGKNLKKNSI
tara:strand:+ start:875 stop:1039 length:165 start_codon:yes stop_codon:yes gene_type:complete